MTKNDSNDLWLQAQAMGVSCGRRMLYMGESIMWNFNYDFVEDEIFEADGYYFWAYIGNEEQEEFYRMVMQYVSAADYELPIRNDIFDRMPYDRKRMVLVKLEDVN